MSSEAPIEFVNLRKSYKNFVAVDNLNLKIKKNSFTGFLGPNGAGKSTSLKILTHLINPTSGNAFLNGVDVTSTPKLALEGVGTVIETPEFYGYLTPRQTFKYIGEILGLTSETIAEETEVILEKVKMTEWADKKLGTFSKGMRQRIALGQALINNPSIVVLDEPTSGLDPRGMAEMRDILKNLRNNTNNLTVFMSSHMLHEVNDLCDRVALLNHGKLLMDDDISVFSYGDGVEKMIIKIENQPNEETLFKISNLKGVVEAKISGRNINVLFDIKSEGRTSLFNQIADLNIGAYCLEEGDNLEARYLELISESR